MYSADSVVIMQSEHINTQTLHDGACESKTDLQSNTVVWTLDTLLDRILLGSFEEGHQCGWNCVDVADQLADHCVHGCTKESLLFL